MFFDTLRSSDECEHAQIRTHMNVLPRQTNRITQHFTDSESIHRVITMAAAASTATAMAVGGDGRIEYIQQ